MIEKVRSKVRQHQKHQQSSWSNRHQTPHMQHKAHVRQDIKHRVENFIFYLHFLIPIVPETIVQISQHASALF